MSTPRVRAILAAAVLASTGIAAAAGSGVSGAATSRAQPPDRITSKAQMSSLIAKAKAEGSLQIYETPTEDQVQNWVGTFEKKYGIKVQLFRAPSNEIYQRFADETRAGKNEADFLILSDPEQVKYLVSEKMLSHYYPQDVKDFPPHVVLRNAGYPLMLGLTTVAWNSKVVPASLQKALTKNPLQAVLNPAFKGKIAVVNISAGGAVVSDWGDLVFHMSKQYGYPYLEKLAKQDPLVSPSNVDLIDPLTSGQVWAVVDTDDSLVGGPAATGAPIEFKYWPTSSANPFYLSISAHAPHPYTARLFMEWASSLGGETAISDITQAESPLTNWHDQRGLLKKSWYKAQNPADIWYGAVRLSQIQGNALVTFENKWDSIFHVAATTP